MILGCTPTFKPQFINNVAHNLSLTITIYETEVRSKCKRVHLFNSSKNPWAFTTR